MASSNDGGVRNFDMETYQLVQHFHYPWPVNVSLLIIFTFFYHYGLYFYFRFQEVHSDFRSSIDSALKVIEEENMIDHRIIYLNKSMLMQCTQKNCSLLCISSPFLFCSCNDLSIQKKKRDLS